MRCEYAGWMHLRSGDQRPMRVPVPASSTGWYNAATCGILHLSVVPKHNHGSPAWWLLLLLLLEGRWFGGLEEY
jgi:hypothetical protein